MKPSTPIAAQASPLAAVALRGVAGGAEFVEVVGHPADADRLGHAEPLEILLDGDRRTDEIARFAHAHRIAA